MFAARKMMMGGRARFRYKGVATATKGTSGASFTVTPISETRSLDLVLLVFGFSNRNTAPTAPSGFTALPSGGNGIFTGTGTPGANAITMTGLSGYSAVAAALTFEYAQVDAVDSTITRGTASAIVDWGMVTHSPDSLLFAVNNLFTSNMTVSDPSNLIDPIDVLGGALRSGNAGIQIRMGTTTGGSYIGTSTASPSPTTVAQNPYSKQFSIASR